MRFSRLLFCWLLSNLCDAFWLQVEWWCECTKLLPDDSTVVSFVTSEIDPCLGQLWLPIGKPQKFAGILAYARLCGPFTFGAAMLKPLCLS